MEGEIPSDAAVGIAHCFISSRDRLYLDIPYAVFFVSSDVAFDRILLLLIAATP